MSIKSESIATELFLKMDEAIEHKDRKAFMKALKPEPAPPIYRLPCSLTGLDAEVDNCYPPAIIVGVEHADDPMSAGCVDRYITTDGLLIDCSIDSVDFAQWFELEELEELEGNE